MPKEKVIVSACLLGEACRYDGCSKANSGVIAFLADKEVIPFCPEAPVLGTPRGRISVVATEDHGLRVKKDADGTDVTDLLIGQTEQIMKVCPNPDRIILKSKSPSCGIATAPILDEAGNEIAKGNGVAADLFLHAFPDIEVSDETVFWASALHPHTGGCGIICQKMKKEIMMLEVGSVAPDFCLENQDEVEICSRDLKGKWIVLYFYPKDNTPGCTTEACDFTEQMPDFKGLNAVIFGVSADSPKSHRGFIEKQGLKITLLSDPEHTMMEDYGVWALKMNYGKEYMGIVRTTYIIDPEGKVAASWGNVKVRQKRSKNGEKYEIVHVEEVKKRLAELQNG